MPFCVNPVSLVALLEPDVSVAIPVDQRAGRLALAYEKRVTAEMRDTSFSLPVGAAFGIKPPRIHPLEVIAAIADGSPGTEDCYLVGRTAIIAIPSFLVERCLTTTAISALPSRLKSPRS